MISKIIAHCTFSLTLFFFLIPVNSGHAEGQIQETPGMIWVWAEKIDAQYAIMLSRYNEEGWQEAEKISDNEAINVTPAVAKLKGDDLLMVWSAFSNGQSKLYYRMQTDGIWDDEAEFYTGLASNTSPSITVDADGTAWIVWAGFNGMNDEIYYSTWDGNEFETPVAITSNSVPDILPVLGLDAENGLPWIQWQMFDTSGYGDYQSTLVEGEWSEPIAVPASEEVSSEESDPSLASDVDGVTKVIERNRLVKRSAVIAVAEQDQAESVPVIEEVDIEIPVFVTVPDSASIFLPGYEIQSLPVRRMVLAE